MILAINPATQPAPEAKPTERIRALIPSLARTELLGPDDLDTYRQPIIASFLAHARANSSFYKDRLDFDLNSPLAIRQAWSSIPILTRAKAVEHHQQLICERLPANAGKVTSKQTSGSTGMPLHYRSTFMFEAWNCALTERMFRWWRVDGKKSLAQIAHTTRDVGRGMPQGTTRQGWHSARPTGLVHSLAHILDIDTQLSWLAARKPSYLSSFSTIIKDLARTAMTQRASLRLDLVFSAAGIVDAEARSLCRSAFGAEIADTYGSQECGHIAAQCPDCGEYHLSADTSIIEILRDDGSPAAPGEIGRVIVTPLQNHAMPLLRYELGDFAEMGAPEPTCARKLPTIRRILGRYRNLFRFRDGTRVWPLPLGFDLQNYMTLKQFQIVQTDFDHVEIRYVPDEPFRTVDLAGLTQRVRLVLGQPVEVSALAVDKIERTANGKFEDCLSLVPFT